MITTAIRIAGIKMPMMLPRWSRIVFMAVTGSTCPARLPGVVRPEILRSRERSSIEDCHDSSTSTPTLRADRVRAVVAGVRPRGSALGPYRGGLEDQQVHLHLIDAQGRQPEQAGGDLVHVQRRRRLRRYEPPVVA